MGKDIYNEIYSNIFKNQNKKPMRNIMYFTGVWCSPCKTLGPLIDKISSQIYVNKIDVDQNKDMVMQYRVKSIPTVILMENGQEVRRFVGIKSEQEILNFIS